MLRKGRKIVTSHKNCMSWWYSQIAGKVPTPKTVSVDATNVKEMMEAAYEGMIDCPPFREHAEKVKKACLQISDTGPWFLRTGQTSNKHDWQKTCFVTDLEKLPLHVGRLVEFSMIADFFGLDCSKWFVREYLPVKPLFICKAYGGMPFVPEWRVFVKRSGIEKIIPYWPQDAIEKGKPDNEDWELIYHAAYHDWPDGIAYPIGGLAMEAFKCLDDQEEPFSVDVLWSEGDQKFYVTDMALAKQSWGYCDNESN